MTTIVDRMKESEARTGVPVRQLVHILDVNGVSLIHRKTLPFMKVSTSMDQVVKYEVC